MRFSAFAVVFAVVFAITYALSVLNNLALFTYHPAIGEFGVGVQKGREGPAMYWYGWLATAGIVASVAGAAAALLPEAATRRLSPALTWPVALLALAVLAWDLRQFFLK